MSGYVHTLEELEELVEQHGNQAAAARSLGMPITTFKNRIVRLRAGASTAERKDPNRSYYKYDEAEDEYTFYSRSLGGGHISVPGKVWEDVVYSFSAQPGGANMTLAEISLENAEYFSRRELENIKKIYGLYKVDPPYTNERMNRAKPEDWADMEMHSLEVQKRKIISTVERKNKHNLQKRVLDLETEKFFREQTLDDIASVMGEVEIDPAPQREGGHVLARETRMTDQPLVVQAASADIHAGMHSWRKESYGGDYDTNIACANITWTGREIVDFVHWSSFRGVVEKVILVDAGDHFHALDGKTESGTILEQDTRPFKVLAKTFEAEVQKIEYIRENTGLPIEWRGSPGNHDHLFFQAFAFCLLQRYLNCEDVTIHTTPRWQDAWLVGKTLHVVDHGKGLPENLNTASAKLTADRVARTAGGDLYFDSRYQVFYTGHLHEESTANEGGHMKLVRLMPMAPGNDYEAKGRWSGNHGFTMYLLNAETGWPEIPLERYLQKAIG